MKKFKIVKKMDYEYSPDKILPSSFLYENTFPSKMYSKVRNRKEYWLSRDQDYYLQSIKEKLGVLFKDELVIDLGGYDSKVLAPVFNQKISFSYLNIDISEDNLLLAEETMRDHPHIDSTFLKVDIGQLNSFFLDLPPVKTYKKRYFLMLGNVFNNLYPNEQKLWLKDFRKNKNINDHLIILFDKRVSDEEHLSCYNLEEIANISKFAIGSTKAERRKNVICTEALYLCKNGVHTGYEYIDSSTVSNFKESGFVEFAFSQKFTIEKAFKLLDEFDLESKLLFNYETDHTFCSITI